MLSSLKINEEIVNSTKFCGVHRLGKSNKLVEGPDRSLRVLLVEKIENLFGDKDTT